MATRTTTFPPGGDVFDIRDVIARFYELENTEPLEEDEAAELALIRGFLEGVKGYGGDHQWRGDWYPVGFIADTYFEDYARELAEDIGAVKADAKWPASYIDWKTAAKALQQDYSSVEIDGITYWYR